MRRMFLFLLLAVTLAALLPACGDDPDPVRITLAGSLSGVDCWFNQPFSVTVRYDVTIEELAEGKTVHLVDQEGTWWQGLMTGDDSFAVVIPRGDERWRIVVTGLTDTQATVEATTSCVSFRCCSTGTGIVAVEAAP